MVRRADPALIRSAALRTAIEELYDAFPDRRDGGPIESCPCCVSETERRTLGGARRDDIPHDVLATYAFKAMTTWGGPEDLRSLVPPVLEALAHNWLPVDPRFTFDKLAMAGVGSWTARERDAIESLLIAWMDVETHGEGWAALRVIECAARAGFAIEPLLASWETADALQAINELAYRVKGEHHPRPEAACPPLERWLAGDGPKRVFERALANHPDDEYAYLWREALTR